MNEETSKDAFQVDASQSEDSLWLMKIPNYLYDEWCKAPDQSVVAKITVGDKDTKNNTTYKLTCNPEFIKKPGVPTVNKFTFLNHQKEVIDTGEDKTKQLSIGSRDDRILALQTIEKPVENGSTEEPQKFRSMVGKVIARCNVTPPDDNLYFSMKSQHIKDKNTPKRVCLRYEDAEITREFKPKTTGNIMKRRNQLRREDNRIRMTKDTLIDKICGLFEKHQYYNIKDIVNLLNQPCAHVKEVLKEVAQVSNQPSRRHMWELKKEYRFYSEDSSEKK